MSQEQMPDKAFISHLMGCRDCYAPTSRYCSEGLALRMENDAWFVAGLEDLDARRRWMDVLRKQYGERMPLIDQLVREMFARRKKESGDG